jgi:hypothetical protein
MGMLHAYRLVYLKSPHAPPTLWEWEQPYIHHLILNARSFQTTRVAQRYFRDAADLAAENSRIWEVHYRACPLYDHVPSWETWLAECRQIITQVQEIYESHTTQERL